MFVSGFEEEAVIDVVKKVFDAERGVMGIDDEVEED